MTFDRVISETSLTYVYGSIMARGRKIALNQYETVIIINPNLEAEDVERIANDVQEIISGSGGVVTRVDNWGKKRLAYEVKGNRDGIYVLIYFEAEPGLVQTLARHYGLTEQIIKYMTVKAENLPEPSSEMRETRDRDEDEDDDDDDTPPYRRHDRDEEYDEDEEADEYEEE